MANVRSVVLESKVKKAENNSFQLMSHFQLPGTLSTQSQMSGFEESPGSAIREKALHCV